MGKNIKKKFIKEIKQKIISLKLMDLESDQTSIDRLKKLIEPLLDRKIGYKYTTPILMPGEFIYRGVRCLEGKPTMDCQLSYPPIEKIYKLGRVNRVGESRFYGSKSFSATPFELNMLSGEYMAISRWRVKEKLYISNVGYTKEVFQKYKSERKELPYWCDRSDKCNENLINESIHKFFSNEFSKEVQVDCEYLYKISIAITELLFGKESNITGETLNIQDTPRDRLFVGLLYPSMAMYANADNVVLLKEYADRCLELQNVQYVYIDAKFPDKSYKITRLDFANSFSDHTIEWKGRLPQWNIEGGSELYFSVEDGQQVIRNKKGEIIEPT